MKSLFDTLEEISARLRSIVMVHRSLSVEVNVTAIHHAAQSTRVGII